MTQPVPVTLVTGFLGAGKTTLLNHVLRGAAGRRIAVIENEFGDMGVDSELLEGAPEAVFQLTDGCVCCSVRADLIDVFFDVGPIFFLRPLLLGPSTPPTNPHTHSKTGTSDLSLS